MITAVVFMVTNITKSEDMMYRKENTRIDR
jgi:hypothetical protein